MAIDLSNTKVGRPPLLTSELEDKIYKYMAEGNYTSTACQAAGVKYDTFLHWQERAKHYNAWLSTQSDIYIDTDLSDLPDHNSDLVYFRFFHRLKTAEALAEVQHVANISVAGKLPQFWAASATYLERKYPDRWGKRDAVDVNVQVGIEKLQQLAEILHRLPSSPQLIDVKSVDE